MSSRFMPLRPWCSGMRKMIDPRPDLVVASIVRMKQTLLWFVVYMVAFSHTAVPFLHTAICIDCLGPTHLALENGNPEYSTVMHFSPRPAHPESGGQHRPGARSFCAACAHASGVPVSHHEVPSLTAAPLGTEAVAYVPSAHFHTIYRPPEAS